MNQRMKPPFFPHFIVETARWFCHRACFELPKTPNLGSIGHVWRCDRACFAVRKAIFRKASCGMRGVECLFLNVRR